jgi:hypothetical protein
LDEHLARLAAEPPWRRSWGATAAVDIDPPREGLDDLRRLAVRALRDAFGADIPIYAPRDRAFALIAGVGCEYEPSTLRERIERALRRAGDAATLRASVGVATYDERPSALDAFRLAEWRAYAEKTVSH